MMKVLSKKLQISFYCGCGKRFVRVYNEAQINSDAIPDGVEKFVYARCPQCKLFEKVILLININNHEQL